MFLRVFTRGPVLLCRQTIVRVLFLSLELASAMVRSSQCKNARLRWIAVIRLGDSVDFCVDFRLDSTSTLNAMRSLPMFLRSAGLSGGQTWQLSSSRTNSNHHNNHNANETTTTKTTPRRAHRVILGPLCMLSTRSLALLPSPATAIPCRAALKQTSDGVTPEELCIFWFGGRGGGGRVSMEDSATNAKIKNSTIVRGEETKKQNATITYMQKR